MYKFWHPLVVLCILVFQSCQKPDDMGNSCSNGFLDVGEEDVDCGGPCDDCPESFTTTMSFQLSADPEIENPPVFVMNETSIKQEGEYWILEGTDYTRTVNLFFKSNGDPGIFQLDSVSNLNINGQFYFGYKNDEISISENDISNRRISGYFSVSFYQLSADDTLHLTAGLYNELSY